MPRSRSALAILAALALLAVPLAGCLEAGDAPDGERPPAVVDPGPDSNTSHALPENATWVQVGESANWTVRATTFPEPVARGTVVPFWVELTPKAGARMPSMTFLYPGVWVDLENGRRAVDIPRQGWIVNGTFVAGTTPGPVMRLDETEFADGQLSATTSLRGPPVPLAEDAQTTPLTLGTAGQGTPSGLSTAWGNGALTATFAFTGEEYTCPPPGGPEGNATVIEENGRQVLVMLISYTVGDVCSPDDARDPPRLTVTLPEGVAPQEVRAHLGIRACFCPPPGTGQGWTTVEAPVAERPG